MPGKAKETDGRWTSVRGHLPWLLAVILIPLVFHATMVLKNYEPLAPDTQMAQPLGQWAKQAEEKLDTIPLWCPGIFSGMPSYGSFIYTPAAWHHLFDIAVRHFAGQRGIRYFLAMMLGGFSLYVYGIRLGFSPPAAAAGALFFVLTPYMAGVIQAGHSTKLRALYHVPLLFLAVEEMLRKPRVQAAALLALSLALLGWTRHPQIAYYALFIAALYAIAGLIWLRPPAWGRKGFLFGLGMVVLAGLLAGVMLLDPATSIREYTPFSERGTPGEFAAREDVAGGTGWDYATAWSFHPKELPSFLVPEWYGLEGATYWGEMPFTQSTHYFGLIALTLSLLALLSLRDRRLWIWAGLALVVLIIGFGRFLPVLYRPMFLILPLFNKFRVPSMIYAILPILVLPLVGAGLRLIQGNEMLPPRPVSTEKSKGKRKSKYKAPKDRYRWVFFVTVALGILFVIWLAAGPGVTDSMRASNSNGPGWFQKAGDAQRFNPSVLPALENRRAEMFVVGVGRSLFLLTLLGVILILRRRRLLPGFWAVVLCGVLLVGDVWVVGKRFQKLEPKATFEKTVQIDDALQYLVDVDGVFRFLPLDESNSNRHAAFGLQSIMGFHPARLRAYKDMMEAGGLQSFPVLDMLQTRFFVAATAANVPGFKLVHDGTRKVYEREIELPRVWFVNKIEALPDARSVLDGIVQPGFRPFDTALIPEDSELKAGLRANGTATLREWSEHELIVDTEVGAGINAEVDAEVGAGVAENGLLVYSEIAYPPGWKVEIDGVEVPIYTVNHILRAVEVPTGSHEVVMTAVGDARSRSLPLSQAAMGVTLLLLLVPAFWRRGSGRGAQPAGGAHRESESQE